MLRARVVSAPVAPAGRGGPGDGGCGREVGQAGSLSDPTEGRECLPESGR